MADSKAHNHTDGILKGFDNLRVDNLITKHRDRFDLCVATHKDVSYLENEVVEDGLVTNRLAGWSFIKFSDVQRDEIYIHLIGTSIDDKTSWCTSQVVATDINRGFVQTKSGSLYELINESAPQPSFELVMHVAATFRSWGMAKPLGMPTVFY